MKKLTMLLLALCMMASMMATAYAAEPMDYAISGAGNPEYGKDTSIEVVHTVDNGAMKNEDVSKNAALAPPAFGTASADTLNTGSPITPNLAPGYQMTAGAIVNGSAATVQPPASGGASTVSASNSGSGAMYAPGVSSVTVTGTTSNTVSSGYTEVTSDLYYSGGYLGTLKIPSIGVNVKVYQGTDTAALAKGAGHFTDSSIWDGTVGIAGHNRGSNGIFGDIHTLELGSQITLTTKLGTRTYQVTSVSKVDETDRSGLASSGEDRLVLYTCVRDQRAYRWCVQAAAV